MFIQNDNVNPMERHKRILNIVSHLGLNKRKRNSSLILQRRNSQMQMSTQYQQQKPMSNESDQDIILLARSRLKPLKQKKQEIRSESKLIEDIINNNYECMKEDNNENNTYQHIQKSLVKIQEEKIMGNKSTIGNIYYKDKFRSTVGSEPFLQLDSPKIKIQNMFEKCCQEHSPKRVERQALRSVRKRLDSIILQSRQSQEDFQADKTFYKTLTKQNKLYQQRTATYFQY